MEVKEGDDVHTVHHVYFSHVDGMSSGRYDADEVLRMALKGLTSMALYTVDGKTAKTIKMKVDMSGSELAIDKSTFKGAFVQMKPLVSSCCVELC